MPENILFFQCGDLQNFNNNHTVYIGSFDWLCVTYL